MKSEIKILLDEASSNKAKGNCFEDLIANLLGIHQYKIRQNIRMTGMEIDILAEHKQRTNEVLYVECKAKEKVSSIELRTFFANVYHHKANFGYFFRTSELEFDAGGLLKEYRADDRYNNLHFFEPEDIITMLVEARLAYEPLSNLIAFSISKRLLAVTYFGDFFIYLINESSALPTKFVVVNAKQNEKHVNSDDIERLQKGIHEISGLSLINNYSNYNKTNQVVNSESAIETISEVQESENWYDYLPASSSKKHFIGRDDIRTKILGFLKEIRTSKSSKRIFYINGKSGWGKSSLVLELKGRCANQHFRKSFFAKAIDTRSANSDNFVALSFKKLIADAIDSGFLERDIFDTQFSFTSNTDLLSSESIKSILEKLQAENKFLVLIFDQFEDVFRKKDFFKTFYKFLSDVTDKKPNLIIGFSWKSDFFIQSDDPSYHIWQQAKEQAREFTIKEFGEKEIDGIIKQLEGSVGVLDKGIRDRIKESSQGLPWLTKKLCIHIFNQIESGAAKENLIESNLNIADLFRKDEEDLSANESKAIKLIAKKAFDGNSFDETEVGEVIEPSTITSLLHKRLIIRSGANYNIYWDIFRDYLVTGKIPLIGESYLLRQGVNLALEVFLLFESNSIESLESLLEKHPKGIGHETLNNILIELRNLGIVQKINENYSVNKDIVVSKQGFIDYITNKFQNYSPYLYLKRLNVSRIGKTEVIQTLKNTFKQEFAENTLEAYANNMINWFLLSDLDIKNKIVTPVKGRGRKSNAAIIGDLSQTLPKSSFKEIFELIPILHSDLSQVNSRYFKDLLLFDLIDNTRTTTDFAKSLINKDSESTKKALQDKILSLPKMKTLKDLSLSQKKVTAKGLVMALPEDFFDGNMQSSKIIYSTKALSWVN